MGTGTPTCKEAGGCHRVVPCDPGCGTTTRWTLTITCPRPSSRARPGDDFFTRPERIAETVAIFFGPDTEVTLTARTVRLRRTRPYPPDDIARLHKNFATALDCLRFNTCTDRERDRYQLPRPVRTEIQEKD